MHAGLRGRAGEEGQADWPLHPDRVVRRRQFLNSSKFFVDLLKNIFLRMGSREMGVGTARARNGNFKACT